MSEPGRIALLTAVKNEGPDLLEWVAYHRLIGFDPIIVYSNDCDDGSDFLLDALQGIGWLTHHRHQPPAGVAPQDAVAALAWADPALRGADWAMWLDADEFLLVHPGAGRVQDLALAAGSADAIAVNWRNFGDNGLTHSPEGLILAGFTKAAPLDTRMSRTVKTLFRVNDKVASLFIHRPVWTPGAVVVLDGAGRPLPEDFVHAVKDNARPEELVPKTRQSHALAQVNHYVIKALDRVALKQRRGNGLVAGGGASRFGLSYLRRFNRNDEVDLGIQPHIPAVRALMDQALAAQPVAKALQDCRAAFRAALSAALPVTETLAAARASLAEDED